jgi:hypothetical protein
MISKRGLTGNLGEVEQEESLERAGWGRAYRLGEDRGGCGW